MAISGSIIPSFSAPKIGGGIGSRASNFIRPKISNLGSIIETISKPIGGGKGANTPKISEGLIGFADTFGSPKTEKVIRRGVSTLRNVLIETYDLAKILVATVKKTSDKLKGGLFGGGKGGGGGLLGGLAGGALAVGVLAVLKKVIIGAAIFMAGKWLLEMTGILKKEISGDGESNEGGQEEKSSGRKIISQDESGTSSWSDVKAEPRLGEPEYDSDGNLIGYQKDINFSIESVPEEYFGDGRDTPAGVFHDGGIVEGKKDADVPATLKTGEAVLPVKTVKMLGVENILGLIESSSGKKRNRPEGFMRGLAGTVDYMTGGLTDFDKRGGNVVDPFGDKPEGIVRGLAGITDAMTFGLTDFDKRGSGLLQFNPIGGGEDKKWGTDGIDGTPGVHGVSGKDGIDGSSSIHYIQSQVTKLIASEPQKKDPKTVVLPIDSNQPPIEVPQPQPREQIVNPNGSAGNSPDIPFPSSTKSDSFGAFETRMIYNIVGG